MKVKKNKPETDTLIYAQLFPLLPNRGQKRIIEILEAAIHNYSTIGLDNTTYDSIAKICGVTRPLIQHYFTEKREIFELALKYIRANFQQMAIEALDKEKTPKKQIEAYIRATFFWIEKFPKHMTAWKLLFYYCSVEKHLRSFNTECVRMGSKRITALLENGIKQGEFNTKDPVNAARRMQIYLTGALLSLNTENIEGSRKAYVDDAVDTCMSMLG